MDVKISEVYAEYKTVCLRTCKKVYQGKVTNKKLKQFMSYAKK